MVLHSNGYGSMYKFNPTYVKLTFYSSNGEWFCLAVTMIIKWHICLLAHQHMHMKPSSLSEPIEETYFDSEPPSRKRLRKRSFPDEGLDEDINILSFLKLINLSSNCAYAKIQGLDEGFSENGELSYFDSKTLLLFAQMPKEIVGEQVETTRLYDAVDVLLKYQSKNGGISSWEPIRTYQWFEKFNPTEVFEDCIFEKEYVECTSAVIQSLYLFKKLYPTYRRHDIESCIKKALQYVIDIQNPDGSWRGNWGICYTYGTWLAVCALAASGMSYNNSDAVRRGCDFLLSKQLPDGGWGESYLSYTNKVYTNKKGNESNLVQTSWSLLALIKGGQVGSDPIPAKKSVKLLINLQEENGDFPQQDSTGAFFNASVLHYTMYRNIFPTWALGEY